MSISQSTDLKCCNHDDILTKKSKDNTEKKEVRRRNIFQDEI